MKFHRILVFALVSQLLSLGSFAQQTSRLGNIVVTGSATFQGTLSVVDGSLAIADTAGLQTALDGKQPLAGPLTGLSSVTFNTAGQIPYATGTNTFGTVTSTSSGRSLLTASALTAAGLGLTNGSNIDSWGAKTPYAGTVVVTTGKTVTISNTLTITATDGVTLNIGGGGTLGTAAYTAATAYDASGSASTAQAYAIQRANHTGTQAWSTITGAPTTLSGYGITNGVTTARTLTTTAPLSGGGDLSADRTLTVSTATNAAVGVALLPATTTPSTVTAAGNTNLTMAAGDVHRGFLVTATSSGTDYTATLTIQSTNATAGLLASVTVTLPANNNGRLQLRNLTSGGTLLDEYVSNGAARTIATRLLFDGTNWNVISRLPTIEVFSFRRDTGPVAGASGTLGNWTWNFPVRTRYVEATAICGGCGGGSGRRGAAGTNRYGGGGGSGASIGFSRGYMPDTTLACTVQVGAGGTGGAAQTADSTDGNQGTIGGSSWVYHNSSRLTAFGVAQYPGADGMGKGGTATTGAGGAVASGAAKIGQAGFAGTNTTGSAAGAQAAGTTYGGAGGAGGAGLNTSDTTAVGGNCPAGNPPMYGNSDFNWSNNGGGTAGGGNGNTPVWNGGLLPPVGIGGTGGGSSINSAAGAGGNGAFPGGGGGGGGASANGYNSGAGGNGADGIAIITVFY